MGAERLALRPRLVPPTHRVAGGRIGSGMKVTVKLGSSLRSKAPLFSGGEGVVELAGLDRARVRDVMAALGIADHEVNLIYRNHRLATDTASVQDGDRIGLFPPNFIHFSQFYLKRDEE